MKQVNPVKYLILVFFLFIYLPDLTAKYQQFDSVGLETKDGKTYILHRVESGETLYSLSRRYHVTVASISKANPESKQGIKIQQILRIPYEKKIEKNTGSVYHTVKSGETMFAISRKYDVRLTDIKKWNDLSSTSLKEGQQLVIYPGKSSANEVVEKTSTPTVKGEMVHTVASAETLYGLARKYDVSVGDIKKWNNLSSNSLNVGQKIVIKSAGASSNPVSSNKSPAGENSSQNDEDKPESGEFKSYETSMEENNRANTNNTTTISKTNASSFNKVVETGFAEVIKTEKNTKKWLALHRTAPVGTILRVKNEMNNLWVFVRVIGTLPETSVNDKVLIRISQTAYDKLGAIDLRFPVEISYVP